MTRKCAQRMRSARVPLICRPARWTLVVLIGVGLMIAGPLIARRRMLSGWARWITLATGGYVFVILFPAGFWAECG
jgi:hypothetical protein